MPVTDHPQASDGAAAITTPTDMDSDEMLMLRHQQGQIDAFEELFRRYERPLHGMLLRRLAFNHAVAAEISQETWLAVIKSSVTYQPTASFRTYLHHIAQSKIKDFLRNQTRDVGHLAMSVEDCDESQMLVSRQPDPEQSCSQQQILQTLEIALQQLPEHHRMMLHYCYQQQMSVSEIATLLQMPIERIKSRLRYAKSALRQLLAPC